MATASFDRKIVIKDQTAVDVILEGLESPVETNFQSNVDVSREIERGKQALKRFSSRSKKSYES